MRGRKRWIILVLSLALCGICSGALAEYAVIALGDRMAYATHGHVYNAAHPPLLQRGDLLLHGHTHVPAWDPFGDRNYCLNPGSVSIPKGGSPNSYMLLCEEGAVWKTLSGEVFHEMVFDR